jgi:signal transduction histidine kinase
MAEVEIERRAQSRLRWVQAVVALGLIGLLTSLHYVTDMHDVAFHNVYRRLYYLPVLILSFSHGLRGGLAAAALVTVVYIPHAFFHAHRDPSPDLDKALEIGLYFVVGGLTGWLVSRQQRVQAALQEALEEQRHMERQLVRAGRLSALGELTAGLAHEIRNPLASILGSAEALAGEFPPEHRKHRMGELLLREIHRLRQVVDEFLNFARPSTGQRQEVDLFDRVQEVVELLRRQARDQEVEPRLLLEPGQAVVSADPGQLSQVLINVSLNALQALARLPASRPRRLEFLLSAQELGQRRYLRLGVRDNGPGIPAPLLESVFNPYFTTRDEGTGLGLSISNRIMEAHGGFLDIESQPGQTTAWLCFPQE